MRYTLCCILTLVIFSLISCSDKRKNDDIFDEFEGEKGVYMVKLPPALFMGIIGMESDKINNEEMGDIDLVKLLVYSRENKSEEDTDNMLQQITGKIRNFEYENIISFNSSDAFVSAYILENDSFVSDLMLLIREDNSLICLGLSGKLDGEAIFNFASEIEYNKLRDFIEEK